ncbi:MAG: helix-turn-helix domain-containing protein [Chloroflexota bacterium]
MGKAATSFPDDLRKQRLAKWLKETLERDHLSLRQAATKTGLSHGTIEGIIKGASPSSETVKRLARTFSGGKNEALALEDRLLILAGYRTQRPEGQDLSQALARVMDRASLLCEPQCTLLMRFAEFLADIDVWQLKEGWSD